MNELISDEGDCRTAPDTPGLLITKVTTGHKQLPKMGQNSIRSSFFARRAKKASAGGRSPPQELEVGPLSGPYILVYIKIKLKYIIRYFLTITLVDFISRI